MFAKLFGKKTDHPLADLKDVQNLINELPKHDAHMSLMELTSWVELIFANNDFKLDHQLYLMQLFDNSARTHVTKLSYDYFIPHEMNVVQENRIWMALHNWATQLSDAYWAGFQRYLADKKAAATVRDIIPATILAAVRAVALQLKFLSARYHRVDAQLWQHLTQYYQDAEAEDYLDTNIQNTSIRHEIASVLAWFGCGVNNLAPLQQHLTERILTQFARKLDLTDNKQNDSLFCFDFANPAAPLQVKVNSKQVESLRYVTLSRIQEVLIAMMQPLEKQFVPENLNLGGVYRAEWVIEAVQHIMRYVKSPPVRRAMRHSVSTNLQVVRGFEFVLQQLAVQKAPSLKWDVLNISVGGFCAQAPTLGLDTIKVGELLATLPQGASQWGVAIIRRLVRDDKQQIQVGAQLLSNQATVEILDNGQHVIWVPIKDVVQEAFLLLKVDTFSENSSLFVRYQDKHWMLIPVTVQERGDDYELIRFKLVEQG